MSISFHPHSSTAANAGKTENANKYLQEVIITHNSVVLYEMALEISVKYYTKG